MAEMDRLDAEPEAGAVDAEFNGLLDKGGELLNAGNVVEARDLLERAYALQPKDSKAQNLLGLTYFKLGIFDRASEIYEALVRDNPVDPTLRVNLGLVYLKLNALGRATREFETAVDLAPDHKKAQNYLGLAYAQAGEYARAKDCFVAAGSLTMAEKMERALKDPAKARPAPEPQPEPPPAAAPVAPVQAAPQEPPPPAEPPPEAPPPREVEIEVEVDTSSSQSAGAEIEVGMEAEAPAGAEVPVSAWESASSAQIEMVGSPPPAEEEAVEAPPDDEPLTAAPEARPQAVEAPVAVEPVAMAPVAMAPPEPERASAAVSALAAAAAAAAGSEMPAGLVLPLGELTRALAAPTGGTAPFEVQRDLLIVRVQGEMLTRLEGLLSISGTVQYLPEMKRFRGKATDKAFGDGDRRMVRLAGAATVALSARGKVFLPVDLAEESAYFLEENVFAFEETVVFENGRVPSRIAPDLHLVHLRGKGRVLLSIPSPARSVAITPGVGCAVPMTVLVGWHGSLTPKIVGLPEERDGVATMPAVELTGEGYALVSPLKPPQA